MMKRYQWIAVGIMFAVMSMCPAVFGNSEKTLRSARMPFFQQAPTRDFFERVEADRDAYEREFTLWKMSVAELAPQVPNVISKRVPQTPLNTRTVGNKIYFLSRPPIGGGVQGFEVYHSETGEMIDWIEIRNPTGWYWDIAYDSVNDTIWMSSYSPGFTVSEVNRHTGALLNSFSVPTNSLGLAYDSIQDALWVGLADYGPFNLYAKDGSLIRSVTNSFSYWTWSMEFNDTSGTLWVIDQSLVPNKKQSIDVSGAAAVLLDECEMPYYGGDYSISGICRDPDTDRFWQACFYDIKYQVYDASCGWIQDVDPFDSHYYFCGAECIDEGIAAVVVSPAKSLESGSPGETVYHTCRVINYTGSTDTFDLKSVGAVWPLRITGSPGGATITHVGPLADEAEALFYVEVRIDSSASQGEGDLVTIEATSQAAPATYSDTAEVVSVVGCHSVSVCEGFDPGRNWMVDGCTVNGAFHMIGENYGTYNWAIMEAGVDCSFTLVCDLTAMTGWPGGSLYNLAYDETNDVYWSYYGSWVEGKFYKIDVAANTITEFSSGMDPTFNGSLAMDNINHHLWMCSNNALFEWDVSSGSPMLLRQSIPLEWQSGNTYMLAGMSYDENRNCLVLYNEITDAIEVFVDFDPANTSGGGVGPAGFCRQYDIYQGMAMMIDETAGTVKVLAQSKSSGLYADPPFPIYEFQIPYLPGIYVDLQTDRGVACPGFPVDYDIYLFNLSGTSQTFRMIYDSSWMASGPEYVGPIADNSGQMITVTVYTDPAASPLTTDDLTVTAVAGSYIQSASVTTVLGITDSWTPFAAASMYRRDTIVNAYNGMIYMAGGEYGTPTGTMERYDPASNIWTRMADSPLPIYGSGDSALLNGHIYTSEWYLGTEMLDYDIDTDAWTIITGVPQSNTFCSMVTLNDKIYRIEEYQSFWEYDPATNTWTQLANQPSYRTGASAWAHDGKIWVAGGWDDYNWVALNTTAVYDPATDTWTEDPAEFAYMPQGAFFAGDAKLGDLFVMVGCQNYDWFSGTLVLAGTVLIYNPDTNEWCYGRDIPVAMERREADVINGQIYICGGDVNLVSEVCGPPPSTPTPANTPTPAPIPATEASGLALLLLAMSALLTLSMVKRR
ncbi:hypothetical protein JXA80_02615 [bacterium]|nr:hypothetical protein [candidate division CSSED10-310 bacterium]